MVLLGDVARRLLDAPVAVLALHGEIVEGHDVPGADELVAAVQSVGAGGALLEAPASSRFPAVIGVPIADSGRRVVGSLCVADDRARLWTPNDIDTLRHLVTGYEIGALNQSVAPSRAHERAAVAQAFQRGLLPPFLPAVPGLQVAARYRAGGQGADLGGDFYDVFSVGDDTWTFVVGDVSGKGVAAATVTALARYTLRATSVAGNSPARTLATLNDLLLHAEEGERFATIALAQARLVDGVAHIVLGLGGQPPPLLVRPSGEVEPVGQGGMALGLFGDINAADVEVRLVPGEALVIATDGLDPEVLVSTLTANAAGDAAQICSAVMSTGVDRAADRRLGDDAVVLVMRVPTDAERAQGEGLIERLPAHLGSALVARRALRPWLDKQSLTGRQAEEIVLVMSELVTNASRAGQTRIELRTWRTKSAIVLEVADDGDGLDVGLAVIDRPPPEAERGRGLYLVRSIADSWEVVPGPRGTTVRCWFQIP